MKDSQHVLSVHILSKFIVIWYWPILHIFSAVSLALSESYHYPTTCASVINLPSQNKAQIACKCPSVMGYVIYTLGGPWHLFFFCFIFFITPSSYCFLAGSSRYFYIVFGALFGKRKTATCDTWFVPARLAHILQYGLCITLPAVRAVQRDCHLGLKKTVGIPIGRVSP